MTMLLVEEPRTPTPTPRPAPPVLTLDAAVSRTWSQLGGRGLATCPACGGRMQARLAPGRAGVVGVCSSCDAELG